MTQNQDLQVITGVLTLITRYKVDGSKGASVWLVVDEDEENEDALGKGIAKIGASYDLFSHEQARIQANEYNLPCLVDVYYKSVMGITIVKTISKIIVKARRSLQRVIYESIRKTQ